jgi:hypothetical protein
MTRCVVSVTSEMTVWKLPICRMSPGLTTVPAQSVPTPVTVVPLAATETVPVE